MTITDEAVEAAARGLFDDAALNDKSANWTNYQHEFRRQAVLALEAAAPHMLAEAWDAGHRTCRLDPDSIRYNPYRNREPQPSDGPDYHAEHAAWVKRQNKRPTP